MQDLMKRMKVLLRARYPIVSLLTHEETRAERLLEKLAEQEGRQIYRWRCTEGLLAAAGGAPLGPDTTDPERAFAAALDVTEAALLVFFDLHAFMPDARLRRRLKDLALAAGARSQTIVLVGAQVSVPEEVEKMVAIVDLPLPSAEEVGRLLTVLCKSQRLRVPPERFERFVKGSLGLTEDEIKRLYARVLLEGNGFSEEDLSLLVEEKRQAIRRSRFLEFWGTGEQIANVGGMDNLKGWLTQREAAFSDRAREFGLPEPKGLFLLGVQGCGKSLMAKAVAELWRMPLLRLDVSAVFQSSGREEESLRETVRIAESLAMSA